MSNEPKKPEKIVCKHHVNLSPMCDCYEREKLWKKWNKYHAQEVKALKDSNEELERINDRWNGMYEDIKDRASKRVKALEAEVALLKMAPGQKVKTLEGMYDGLKKEYLALKELLRKTKRSFDDMDCKCAEIGDTKYVCPGCQFESDYAKLER